MHLPSTILPLLALGASAQWGRSSSSNEKKTLLSDVASLTLRADRMTSHRRVPPIPQLKCLSPREMCRLHKIDVMRCVNAGSGYGDEDIQWTCTANLPIELKLGRTDVICEGYNGPDDKYVLKGSCGVEYTMILTGEGRKQHPGLDDGTGWTWGGVLFAIVFVGIVGWMIWSACFANRGNVDSRRQRPGRRWGSDGWGGGPGGGGPGAGGPGGWGPGWGPGGGEGNNDPPPPYPGTTPKPSDQQQGQQGQQGWRPGFWSGLSGGAAAGYLAGQGRNRQDDYYSRNRGQWGGWGWGGDRDRYDDWGRHGYGGRNYGSTWGSGHGHDHHGSYERSNSSGSSTGATHDSIAFGSTSRR